MIADTGYARRFSLYLSRSLDSGILAQVSPDFAVRVQRALTDDDFAAFADWQKLIDEEDEAGLAQQLRRLRRVVMAHLITRDLCRVCDLAEVTGTMTRFADFAVNTALAFAHRYYVGLYGEPTGSRSGAVQHLSVVAMGKAGGFELNVSSDLDLIFVYPEKGETNGRRERSNQEFFTKVGQKLIALLHDITADGQVFRIDMRLRPDGDSGALVLSEAALEQYLMLHGREWERYAWCKGRVVTPYANGIAALVRPFVFRRYLDYGAYEAMRALHKQIRAEVSKRGMADNIKLGAGGIREIEFIAQIFQMIRGGQNRALQKKGTQETLLELQKCGILSAQEYTALYEAYRFLRDTEHRLQYWDDCQTQTLPENPEQQNLLAQSMGFADYAGFSGSLAAHRAAVNSIFTEILHAPEQPESARSRQTAAVWENAEDHAETSDAAAALGFGADVAAQLHRLKMSARYQRLSENARNRFDALVPRILEAAAESAYRDAAAVRLLDFLESVSRRSSYLAFLQQYPAALKKLADWLGQSSWLADYLQRHPILLDEMLSAQLMQPLDWNALDTRLAADLAGCEGAEAKMDCLRRFQHAQIFRLGVQDLNGMWTLEALSDELSRLADIVIAHTLAQVWQELPRKHRDQPQFAVIAYGKLGGKELGYVSDLDLVYLYADDHPDAAEVYAKLARRLTTWLSGSTGAGNLYDVDLRLRPNGESGFLVHSMAAFEKYQRENAWTWEHQALTRARFVCGDAAIGSAFEGVRREILTAPRDLDALVGEVLQMRDKISLSHPPQADNVKYARGGVVDVEFIVQFLVLSQSRNCPELLENYGNIALLEMAAARGLIAAAQAEAAREAYRFYRQVQHNKKLRDHLRVQADGLLTAHYQAVVSLWHSVFGVD